MITKPDKKCFNFCLIRASSVFVKRMKNILLLPDKIFHLTSIHKRDSVNRNFIFHALLDLISVGKLDDADEIKQNIFIHKLMRRSDELSHEHLKDHVLAIGAAAFDALASSSAYCVLFLAMYHDVQKKVFSEIISCGLKHDKSLTLEKLAKLKYLELVIKETMRLTPGVHGIGREPMKDLKLSESCKLSKGTIILINIFMLHRRKDLWGDDAHKFNPDRFLPENLGDRHNFFIPFSAGRRNCIGERYAIAAMKIIIVKLLTKFEFSTKLQIEDFIFERQVAIKLLNGHVVSVLQRH